MRVQIYEWLKKDGYAYIQFDTNSGFDGVYEIDFAADSNCGIVCYGQNQTQPCLSISKGTDGWFWLNAGVHKAENWNIPKYGVLMDLNEPVTAHIEVVGGTKKEAYIIQRGQKKYVSGVLEPYLEQNLRYFYLFEGRSTSIQKCGKVIFRGIHLRPCRLLSPYTSADGKLHPQGECCMIDINTNTLYFNSGSGAFSVEGEAGEIIDTTPFSRIMHKRNDVVVRLREWLKSNQEGDKIIVDFPLNPNTPIKAKVMLDMSEQYPHNGRHFFRFDNTNYAFYGNGIAGNPIRLSVWDANGQFNKSYVAKNGLTEVEFYSDRIITEFGNFTWDASRMSMMLQRHSGDAQCQDIINGEVWQDGVFHLHPCDLLHHPTLPPQSCMIDLLTGQLYTNQGSGSFSCEGADLGIWQSNPVTDMVTFDANKNVKRLLSVLVMEQGMLKRIWEKNEPWEEHRWLVANVPTGCTMLTLQVNDTLRYKRLWKQLGNVGYVRNDNFAFYSADNNKLNTVSIWNIKTQSSGLGYLIDDGVIDVSINPKNYKIGTFESQDYLGDNILFVIGNNANGQREAIFNTSTITIDGHTLTPALLDRPTLAEEDNNNIARKQGECVLVDEKRYKQGLPWCFGNVASSGSFSVSDYLIEGEDYEVIEGVYNGDYAEGLSPWIDLNYIPKSTDTIRIDYLVKDNGVNINGARVLTTNVVQTWGSISSFINNEPKYIMYGWHSGYAIRDFFNTRISSVISNSGIWYNDTKLNISEEPNFDVKGLRIGRDFGIRTSSPFVLFSLKIDGVIDLIPVRLKKSIDPTCTHNGKGARQGEIGFFDKVSGRFYGNDGSGEFGEYVPE